jgi:hypothetical protein
MYKEELFMVIFFMMCVRIRAFPEEIEKLFGVWL